MFRILRKSLKTGIVTGQHDASSASAPTVADKSAEKARSFRRSLTIREVDTGSCNGCEMEMNALMNPVYDAERFGIHIAASPRHADALAVTGESRVLSDKSFLSDLQDLDYASAISEFYQRQTALQASQQTFVRIQQISLFNYL